MVPRSFSGLSMHCRRLPATHSVTSALEAKDTTRLHYIELVSTCLATTTTPPLRQRPLGAMLSHTHFVSLDQHCGDTDAEEREKAAKREGCVSVMRSVNSDARVLRPVAQFATFPLAIGADLHTTTVTVWLTTSTASTTILSCCPALHMAVASGAGEAESVCLKSAKSVSTHQASLLCVGA